MQSVPITTEVVSSNPAQARCPLIKHVLKFVSDLLQVGGFFRYSPKTNERHELTEISQFFTMRSIVHCSKCTYVKKSTIAFIKSILQSSVCSWRFWQICKIWNILSLMMNCFCCFIFIKYYNFIRMFLFLEVKYWRWKESIPVKPQIYT